MQPDVPRPVVARTGWVVLTAFLTELIVVAGVGNQAVTNAMNDHLGSGRQFADYTRGAIDAMLTFQWRFAPRPAQSTHDWAAQFLLLAVLFGLTALAVWATCRGVVTFLRVFVTVWAIVIAVTPLAIMARNLVVIPTAPGPLQSRVGQSVYYFPDFGPAIIAGVVLGFVTGVVAAFVAKLTRRPVIDDSVRPAPAPYDPRDHYLEERFAEAPQEQTTQLPRVSDGESTTQLPRVSDGESTAQLPSWPPRDPQS